MAGNADRQHHSAGALWRKAGLVWLALSAVLAATVAGAYLAPQAVKLPLALGLAAVKAGLVLAVFMELFDTRASARIAALVAVLFVGLLFALSFADKLTRPDLPPSFAPPPVAAAPPA